jgi:hypothetical protein
MMMRIWINVGFRTVEKVIGALKSLSISLHRDAGTHKDSQVAAEIRRDADEIDAAAEEVRKSFHNKGYP